MARRIALLAALAPLVLPAVAGAATPARFFAGTPVDGPSADIQALGDLDVARDGTGALAYVKRVAGIDHVFVSRELLLAGVAADAFVDDIVGIDDDLDSRRDAVVPDHAMVFAQISWP